MFSFKYILAVMGRFINYLSLGKKKNLQNLIVQYFYDEKVDLNEADLIPKEKKLLTTAYESTSIQYAFRKKRRKMTDSILFQNKNEALLEYFKRKMLKWKTQTFASNQGK